MVLVNLTPHPCVIFDEQGNEVVQIAPSGQVARVKTAAMPVGKVSFDGTGIPIVETKYGAIEDLPLSSPDTMYIVSVLVVVALRQQGLNRPDVIAPDTGTESVVRDAEGKIKGVKRFTR